MRVRVLLFGPQAASAGRRVVLVPLGDDRSCGALKRALAAALPSIAGSVVTSRVAVNHEFAPEGCLIHEGDEVALIGMVAGG